jgi:hypothetical protein
MAIPRVALFKFKGKPESQVRCRRLRAFLARISLTVRVKEGERPNAATREPMNGFS